MATRRKKVDPIIGEHPLSEWERLLTHNDLTTRFRSESQFRDAVEETNVPTLIHVMRSGKAGTPYYAASALGELGGVASAAIPDLIAALDEEPACQAALSLAKIGMLPDKVVPALMAALDSTNIEVCRSAITALGQFGSSARPAIPKLAGFLTKEVWFQFTAANALANLGPVAKKALPALEKALRAKDREVRHAVESAIHRISGAPLSPDMQQRKNAQSDKTLIDFRLTKEVVARMVGEGMSRFVKEHPDVEISCVGLFAEAFGRSVALCLETPEHSAKHVKKWAEKLGVGKDRFGQFNDNMYEFKYLEYDTEEFDFWPDLYEIGPAFRIKMPSGRVIHRSFDKGGNKAIEEPLLKLLEQVLREAKPFKGLRFAKPFRLGVQIPHSDAVKFWIPTR